MGGAGAAGLAGMLRFGTAQNCGNSLFSPDYQQEWGRVADAGLRGLFFVGIRESDWCCHGRRAVAVYCEAGADWNSPCTAFRIF
ncbi:MAG TPA: hypothetical protein DIT89_16800 [Planctomycetaceae bacterium]|nr:hypothetical protein [Planctomycetaceae bacterium]